MSSMMTILVSMVGKSLLYIGFSLLIAKYSLMKKRDFAFLYFITPGSLIFFGVREIAEKQKI